MNIIWTDSKLYSMCKEYGANARLWRAKFAGLLPEVYRRRLYKKRGFCSIHEFAAKLSGMSRDSVDKVLRLHEKFIDMPLLREKLISGEVGWSKLEVVAGVATAETDRKWAARVKLSRRALELCVQDAKKGLVSEPEFSAGGVNRRTMAMKLDEGLITQLQLLKQKLEKQKGEPLEWNRVIKELLNGYERGKGVQKTVVEKVCPDCVTKKTESKKPGRQIPAAVNKLLLARYGGLCAVKGCQKIAVEQHHTRRFALKQNHDPRYLVPVCRGHHDLAHGGMIEHEEDPDKWKIREYANLNGVKGSIDRRVLLMRGS